jgi:acetamidase/formamidase
MAEYSLSAAPTHSRWNRALPPRLRIASGDAVRLECVDSSGAQCHPSMTLAEYLKIDRDRIHALTGPIFVDGADPGDVLQVDVLEVAHKGWGWTSVVNGLGFLKQRFSEPFFFVWKLEGAMSKSIASAVVPLRPFCGVMGVAPAEDGEFRTRPPGIFGGNMDVRELCDGATLYLPVLNRGALFSAGDAHAAQGDGEVCINGIECPADVTLRFQVHKQRALPGPILETSAGRKLETDAEAGEWIVVESAPDATAAARAATSRMVDLLADRWGLSEVHAYLLCSVAMNLRFSQVVNEPIFTVSAAISKQILPARKLF